MSRWSGWQLPLLTIGLSFIISRGIIGFLTWGGFRISTFTETFLIAVLFGAGTDYCMLTLIPAFFSMFGDKVFWPAKSFSLHNESLRTGFWARLAGKVTAMPVRFLLIPLLFFVPFLYWATGMTISYDNMKDLPAETSSIKGFTVMSEHFRKGDLLPVRVTLKTDKDLYGTDSLKVIDAITENLLKVENVEGIRSATRPLGEKLTQASLGSQITLLSGGMKDVSSGFTPIMDGITSIREGITKALATSGGIITSCGVIMAGTFGSMMFSPMRPMVQVGFAACVGIIIDTFVIRSLVVPSIAVLVGEMSWWPGRKVVVTSLERGKRVAS